MVAGTCAKAEHPIELHQGVEWRCLMYELASDGCKRAVCAVCRLLILIRQQHLQRRGRSDIGEGGIGAEGNTAQ